MRKGNESLYENHPYLKEVLVWDKKQNKLKNLFSLLNKIRSQKYDAVINCHRFASSGFLTAFSGAKYKVGYKQNPFSFLFSKSVNHVIGDGRHETFRYNQLIENITDKTIAKPKLYPTPIDSESVKDFKKQIYVSIAPSSVWYTKQLPKQKWIELINKLSDKTIYLLGASNDLKLCEDIKMNSSNKNIRILAGQLSFLQSCALMRDAEMNYVNDSAPLHLASAINAPVTAYFCSTIPAFGFGPLSDNSKIIEVKNLDCRPCGLHGWNACPKKHFKCGNDISHELH